MFGVDVYGAEDFGCSLFEDGTASTGTLHGSGAKDRQEEARAASRKAEAGLFEDIGRYFHLFSQAEQMEAQDAFDAENIRTYTATGGFQFVSDTKSPQSL